MKIKNDVTFVLCTYNNEVELKANKKSLSELKVEEIIIVDGGSTDSTVEAATKISSKVICTSLGFAIQSLAAMNEVKTKYVIFGEPDLHYGFDFVINMVSELENSSYIGLRASVRVKRPKGYFSKGLDLVYQIHHEKKGRIDAIGGPNIFYYDQRIIINRELQNNSYSIDAEIGEICSKHGWQVGLGYTQVYHNHGLDMQGFVSKYFKYGTGDYYYYKSNSKNWNFRRKLKSLSHIFVRYCTKYPIRAIQLNKISYLPFLLFSAFFRYLGWIWEMMKHDLHLKRSK